MKKEEFYLLTGKGDGCHPPHTGERIPHFTRRCKNCGKPLDGMKQIDSMISEAYMKYLPKQKPLTFIWGNFGMNLVWEPFIRTVPAHILDRDMYFGDVLGQNGKRIEGWLTYHCRYHLQMRGTGKGGTSPCKVTVCKDCGYVRWFAHSPRFLYPAPPEDAEIFQYSGSLLFRESVYQYLDMEQWKKKVYVTKIKVADKPLDGLDLPQFEIPRDLKWVAEHPDLERC